MSQIIEHRGKFYERTGEIRPPKRNEWFWSDVTLEDYPHPLQANIDFGEGTPLPILREVAAPAQPFDIEGSLGKVTIEPGQRFAMDGVLWEIVGKVKEGVYSPVGVGGTSVVNCRLISGEPAFRLARYMKDGCLEWCGDSLATAVISYNKNLPAPAQGEPGEARKQLAIKIYDAIGAETQSMMADKKYWTYEPPDEKTRLRMIAVIEAELTRWGRTEKKS